MQESFYFLFYCIAKITTPHIILDLIILNIILFCALLLDHVFLSKICFFKISEYTWVAVFYFIVSLDEIC